MRKERCPNCSAEVPLEDRVKGICGACGGPLLPQTPLQSAATRLAAVQAGIPVPEKPPPRLPLFIDCPVCGQPTGNLKCYRMGLVTFFCFALAWSVDDELGCPRCIRRKLLGFTLVNLLTANVLWPALILPVSVIHLVASFWPGHSPTVREHIQRGAAAEPDVAGPPS
jgi:hypothetical protein